jgi:hypothetical protein
MENLKFGLEERERNIAKEIEKRERERVRKRQRGENCSPSSWIPCKGKVYTQKLIYKQKLKLGLFSNPLSYCFPYKVFSLRSSYCCQVLSSSYSTKEICYFSLQSWYSQTKNIL